MIPGTPEHAVWQAEQLVKNKKASAKRARWARTCTHLSGHRRS